MSAVELGVHAARGALERSGISPALGAAPLGRIVSWGVAGVDPDIMGIGPVPASRQALHRAGLGIQKPDLVEINEAFAAQYLAVERELGPWWWRRFMTSLIRTATAALLGVLLGAAAPAAAEELRQGLNAPLILQMLSRPADKPETIMKEGLRRDAELSRPPRPTDGQAMPDGSVRYGTDAASVSVTIKNPCPPGDIAHEMAVPLPGRGRR